jgi:hypothetical protein
MKRVEGLPSITNNVCLNLFRLGSQAKRSHREENEALGTRPQCAMEGLR